MCDIRTQSSLVSALDVFGIGIPIIGGLTLAVAGLIHDPLYVVSAFLLFMPYAAAYVVARIVEVPPLMALVLALVLIVAGTVALWVTSDANWTIYCLSPGTGVLVSTAFAARVGN